MEISDKLIEDFKDLYKKKGKEITDQEAREAATNFAGYIDLLWDIAKKDATKKKGGKGVRHHY